MQNLLLLLLACTASLSLIAQSPAVPIDGLFAESGLEERRLLPYPSVRAADITYQKKQTRVIDTRELLNLSFRHPDLGFFRALQAGVEAGELTVYDPAYPDFSRPLIGEEWLASLSTEETIRVIHPETGEESWEQVRNLFDPSLIMRYRLREIVFFDRQTSTQRTRIIGIAPLLQARDELGQTTYEYILGWIYWPQARTWFDSQQYFLAGSDQAVMSWADAFDMRRFSSYILERSNVRGNRLNDHYQGRRLLLESRKLEAEQASREHDMWSY